MFKPIYQIAFSRFFMVLLLLLAVGCTAPVSSLNPQTSNVPKTERGSATITFKFDPPKTDFSIQALPANTATVDLDISAASGGPVYNSKKQIIEVPPFSVTDEIRRNGKSLTIADLPTITIRITVRAFDAKDNTLASAVKDFDIRPKSQTGGQPIDGKIVLPTTIIESQKPASPIMKTPTVSGCPASYGVTLVWESSVGASSYKVHRDGTLKNGNVTGTSYSDSGLGDDFYNYQIFACNGAGCSEGTTQRLNKPAATTDCGGGGNLPPVITISNPSSGGSSSGSVSVQTAASDSDGISRMELYIDNDYKTAENNVTSLSYNWDTTIATNGTHTIKVIAKDGKGLASEQTKTVTVSNEGDLPPPNPVNGSASGSSGNYTVTVSWSSVSGASYYQVSDNWRGNWASNPVMLTSASMTTSDFFGDKDYVDVSVKACKVQNNCSVATTVRIPKPTSLCNNPTAITNGQTVTVCLDKNRQRLSFSGSSGQKVTVSQNKVSTGDALLRLYNPSGAEVASDDDGGGSANSRISDYTLTSSGTWQIEAGTFNDSGSGNFTVSLMVGSVDPPPPPPTIIGSYGSDGYVRISWGSVSGANSYKVFTNFNDQWSTANTNYEFYGGNTSPIEVWVKACNNNGANCSADSNKLTLTKQVSASCTSSSPCTIGAAEKKYYTFNGSAGQIFSVDGQLTSPNSGDQLYFDIISPSGETIIANNYDGNASPCCSSPTKYGFIRNFTLPSTGTFTFKVSGSMVSGTTGTFTLSSATPLFVK